MVPPGAASRGPLPLLWRSAKAFLALTPVEELEAILRASGRQGEDRGGQLRVPRGLFPALLATAMQRDKPGEDCMDVLSVRLLVKHWPDEELALSEVLLAERDLNRFGPFQRQPPSMSKEQALLKLFLDLLDSNRTSTLRTLDLRGLPSNPTFILSSYLRGRHAAPLFARGAEKRRKSEYKQRHYFYRGYQVPTQKVLKSITGNFSPFYHRIPLHM